MGKKTLAIGHWWFLLLFYWPGKLMADSVVLPSEVHELVIFSIQNVYSENFNRAKDDAERIIKKFPNSPAGYFFYAAVLNAKMEYLQSEKYEVEFYKYCDLSIEKGEEIIQKDPNNRWALFFIAGANGFKGKYESRYERWVTAFKHGWAGVDMLQDLLERNPEMEDALYGVSTYNYWRSVKTRMLWWLPGIIDKRSEAIPKLFTVVDKGVYTRECAALDLIDILFNEKRYSEVLELSEKLLKQYPNNLACVWGKAKAFLGLKEYEKAESLTRDILQKVSSDEFDSNYNVVLCHYYLLEIYAGQKKYRLCVDEYNAMISLSLSSLAKKRLEKYFDTAEDLFKKSKQELSMGNNN